MPGVVGAAEEIFDFKVFVVRNRELFQGEIDPAGLFLGGIEVNCDKNAVASARFAEAEDVRIVDGMEVEEAVAVECGVVASNLIDLGDQRSEAVAGRAVPMANLVLFAVEILFTSLLRRSVFAKLEGWAIDTVVWAQGSGKDQALHKGRAPAGLKRGVEDVGGVGPEIGMKEIRYRRPGDLFEVFLQLVLGIAPGEVGVGLSEARLGE